jgi:lambda family phage portal protein
VFLKLDDAKADELELAMQRVWDLWACTSECDVERQATFAQQTKMVCHGMLVRGDVFGILPMIERPGSPYETKVQVIEADRVSNKDFAQDTDECSSGIERGPGGDFAAIWVTNKHPGSIKTTARRIGGRAARRNPKDFEWTRIPAFGAQTGRRNVLHVFDKRRPGQSRGVPDLAAIIEPLKQLGRYTEAEITAAVVSGMFTVFVKSTTGQSLQPMQPTADSKGSESDEDMKLMSGGIVSLLPGEEIDAPNPGRPNDKFDPFVKAILMQIGMALELPYELLVKMFMSSYSASRAAINEAFKYFIAVRALIVDTWNQPVYEAVIEEAVLKGRLALPGFTADPAIRRAYLGASWIGPGRGQINEVQEVEAAVARIDATLSTKSQETAALNGGDYEANVRTRRREIEAEKGMRPEQQPSSGALPDPDDEDVEDDERDEPDKPPNEDEEVK